jgi:3-oxoacyl-[acyl-carrier protein] reductase
VTGASRGIGRAAALRLARDGFAVVINYAGNHDKAAEVVKEITGKGGRAIGRAGGRRRRGRRRAPVR